MRPATGLPRPREAFAQDFTPAHDQGDVHDAGRTIARPLLTMAVILFCFHLWRLGDINITVSDTLFVMVVLIELGLGRLNAEPFGSLTPLWLGSLVLMLAALFVGSYFNGDLLRWVIVAAQYLFSYMLLPMILVRGQTGAHRLIVLLIIGMVMMESLGVAVYYIAPSFTEANAIFGPDFITGGKRLGAMVGDANWNGAVIAMTLPFVLYAGVRRLMPMAAALGAGAMLTWALMLAASFTGFCAALLALGVMCLIGRLRPSPQLLLALALLGGGLYASGYQMPEVFAKRVAPAFESGNLDQAGTYDDRAELIAEAWNNAEHTLIIGMGVDQFREFSPSGQPVHNMYMLQLAEGGVFAVAGWIGVCITLALIPLLRIRRNPLEAALSLAVIVVFQVFAMASPHMYARLWMVPVLLSVGLVINSPASPFWAGRSPKSARVPRPASIRMARVHHGGGKDENP